MKHLISLAALIAALLGITQPAQAHHQPGLPLNGTILPGQQLYDLGARAIPELAALTAHAPPRHIESRPAKATGCYISPSTGSWAKGTCPGYSGTGSRGFQIIGRAWNHCNTTVIIYGSIGVAGSRSSYIPSSGPGTFLPWPWTLITTWTVHY